MKKHIHTDVLVVGAGPAGVAALLSLKHTDLKLTLVEKAQYPRDKICGDALSPDVLNQLEILPGKLRTKFLDKHTPRKVHISGIRLKGTKENAALMHLTKPDAAHGWVVRRADFDQFLFDELKGVPNLDIHQNTTITDVVSSQDEITVESKDTIYHAKLLLAADGANSVVHRKLNKSTIDRKNHSAAVRAYYKNVGNTSGNEYIELHFYKQAIPGYFWIFPLSNGEANVGLGMLSSQISKKNIDLKKLFHRLIETEPELKERFKNAKPISKPTGFGLPLGSKKRKIYGHRYMLLGDAASLIDPVSGEGVANAIRSGRYAAEYAEKCFANNDFSEQATKPYSDFLFSKIWNELRLSRFLLRTVRYPFLLNLLINAMRKRPKFRAFLNTAISDPDFWANGFKLSSYRRNWKASKKT